jgi:hypothetical protein
VGSEYTEKLEGIAARSKGRTPQRLNDTTDFVIEFANIF